ncbi:ORFA [Molluscum contagiosum virus subtype 1]|uniref:ORFA n=1 Tax=Molluscum contagiosum virus subtype 1 TaxID=10280 RepID=A0A7G5AX56_MCV1|nr:ORFA [Molluscum contagiosum virus subtype 1]
METCSLDTRIFPCVFCASHFDTCCSRSLARSLCGPRPTMVVLRVEPFSRQARLAAPRSSCEQPYSRTRDVRPASASALPHTKLTTTSLRSAE